MLREVVPELQWVRASQSRRRPMSSMSPSLLRSVTLLMTALRPETSAAATIGDGVGPSGLR